MASSSQSGAFPVSSVTASLVLPTTPSVPPLVVMLNITDWRVQLAVETGHVESNVWIE